jgi:CRISPR-associated endonuclease/helicase Cas3
MKKQHLNYGLMNNKILAKSSPEITLFEHTMDCMLILKFLKNSVTPLSEITSIKDGFWDVLFIAIFFHDIGKSTRGFQDMLRNRVRYNFRHERISAAIFNSVTEIEDPCIKDIITRVILTHHKKVEKLKDIINDEFYDEIYDDEDDDKLSFSKELESIEFNLYEDHFSLFNEIASNIFGRKIKFLKKINKDFKKSKDVLNIELKNIQKQKEIDDYIFLELILWGALKNCDHIGSAGVKDFSYIGKNNMNYLKEITEPYYHQKFIWCKEKDFMLIAPTGSGKTEAAFGWAFNIIKKLGHRHIFYFLPYTASINAMYKRLSKDIDDVNLDENEINFSKEATVSLIHGRLRQYISSFFNDDEISNKELKSIEKSLRIISKPIKITTPYQVLKYVFGVKDFEKGIIELAGSLIICDEIHAYNKEMFFKILWTFDWLKKNLKVKFLIMTATLPKFIQNLICETLDINSIISAEKSLLDSFNRHKVNIIEGKIENNLDLIKSDCNRYKKILIVCNTVNKAQLIYEMLKELDNKKIALLHSRFTYKDRTNIEMKITGRDSDINVLIGTQAIEVSLNIDYDVIYTEPAPLDALLQRFGRVNRARLKGISNVNVFSIGGDYDFKIYDKKIIENTLLVLEIIVEDYKGIIIENKIQYFIDRVYEEWDLEESNLKIMKNDFYNMMNKLMPYKEHKITEEEFESQFDSIEIVPNKYFSEYVSLINEDKFIEADMYKCQLNKSSFRNPSLRDNIRREKIKNKFVLITDCYYDETVGLVLDKKIEDDNFL